MLARLPLLPDAFALTINSILLAAADATITPGVAAAWVKVLEERVAQEGKFSKFSVLYTPVQPPPFFWDYNCRRCLFWQEPNRCKVVDGFIARGGWCATWMPPVGVRPFTFLPRVVADAPTWLTETPQAFQKWIDTGWPKELWGLRSILSGSPAAGPTPAPRPPGPGPTPAPPPPGPGPTPAPTTHVIEITKVTQTTIPAGQAVEITTIVTLDTSQRSLVDIEVYNPTGAKIFQDYFDDIDFLAGSPKTVMTTWKVPLTQLPGTYTVKVGLFPPAFATPSWYWDNHAAQIAVTAPLAPSPPLFKYHVGSRVYVNIPHWNNVKGTVTELLAADLYHPNEYFVRFDPGQVGNPGDSWFLEEHLSPL